MEPITVSICIPTCNRPRLLREALLSCAVQTRKPDCIVVGDDSATDDTEKVVSEFAATVDIPVDYRHNRPPLLQSGNTNSVFDRTASTHLMLLHDDDLLLPSAVEELLGCWERYPGLTAAYGKQIVISHDGVPDLKASERLNRSYCRSSEWAGLQKESWQAGVRQQFPNNGYLLRTAIAQATRWRPESEVGNAGDFEFGLRLALTQDGFFFLDKFTTKVRLTCSGSISSSRYDDAALYSYSLLEQCALPDGAGEVLRSQRLMEIAPRAMMEAIRHGQLQRAFQLYLSPHHGWRIRLSPGGVRRSLLLALCGLKLLNRRS